MVMTCALRSNLYPNVHQGTYPIDLPILSTYIFFFYILYGDILPQSYLIVLPDLLPSLGISTSLQYFADDVPGFIRRVSGKMIRGVNYLYVRPQGGAV